MAGVAIGPGDIYEDCAFHPVLCLVVHDDGSISGVSLIDASWPRNCSPDGCAPIKLMPATVLEIRKDLNGYVERRLRETAPTLA